LLDGLVHRGIPIEDETRRVVRAAALVHDVGHLPFGHTFEDERRILERHDKPERLRRALTGGELGQRMRSLGLGESVLAALLGQRQPFHGEVTTAAIGADLLDYLARDAYFAGVAMRYDSRIFRQFSVAAGQLIIDAQKDGALREDVISEVINLLRLRYFLSERVYYHHTKTASGAMISRAVEFALAEGLAPHDLEGLRDDGLLALLAHRFRHVESLVMLLSALERHAIYKRCYMLTRRVGDSCVDDLVLRYHLDRVQRERAEQHIERTLRLRPGDLIIYCPDAAMALKAAAVPVKVDRGPPVLLADLGIPEVAALQQKHYALWKFYVFVHPRLSEQFRRIGAACEEFFAIENHLPPYESRQRYFTF
jgi:HD superfamily phosphohydrolase